VQYAHWKVVWRKADGKLVTFVPEPKTDMVEAQRIYEKALAIGRKPTLICTNVGFPPPDKYADRERVLLGRRKGTKTKVYKLVLTTPRQYFTKMWHLNRQGVWWCPYCRKLRRFVKRKGFRLDGIWVPDEHMGCPVCKITHRDGHVRRYNPVAQTMPMHTRKGRQRRRYRNDDE
jgi:hypothetical protein